MPFRSTRKLKRNSLERRRKRNEIKCNNLKRRKKLKKIWLVKKSEREKRLIEGKNRNKKECKTKSEQDKKKQGRGWKKKDRNKLTEIYKIKKISIK